MASNRLIVSVDKRNAEYVIETNDGLYAIVISFFKNRVDITIHIKESIKEFMYDDFKEINEVDVILGTINLNSLKTISERKEHFRLNNMLTKLGYGEAKEICDDMQNAKREIEDMYFKLKKFLKGET